MDNIRDRLNAALANRYRIERELGGGGMSRVFQATETDLGRAVVIKVVPTILQGMSAERFTHEVKLAPRKSVPERAAGPGRKRRCTRM